MEKSSAIRRQLLEEWRKRTGRTPMKRLSYVQECYKQSPSTEKSVSLQAVIQRSPMVRIGLDKKTVIIQQEHKNKEENVPPRTPKLVTTTSTLQKKLTRREMLDQWLAVHGSTVKRPRSVLGTSTTLNQCGARTEARPKPPKNQFTMKSYSVKRLKKMESTKPLFSPHTLKSLKEQFQKDIEETVAEIRANEGNSYSPCDVQDIRTEDGAEYSDELARGLDYDDDGVGKSFDEPPPPKVKSRRSIANADPDLIFCSSTIKYSMSLSEPRRKLKRRSTALTELTKDQLVLLTPVRRSTRKNRCCPGLMLDQDLCFDSPGQLAKEERYHDTQVEIIPNSALDFDV